MTIALSSLFSAELLGRTFDNQANEQAAKGRIYVPLTALLKSAYGLAIPQATAPAIAYINGHLLMQPKAPALVKGVGAKSAAVTVTQALHAYAVAVRAGMSDATKAPAVLPLPAWADPVAIAAKKDDAKAKRLEKANAAASDSLAAALTAPIDVPAEDIALAAALTAPVDVSSDLADTLAKMRAFIAQGLLTVAQRDALVDALVIAETIAEPVTKAETQRRKVARKSVKAYEKGESAPTEAVAA